MRNSVSSRTDALAGAHSLLTKPARPDGIFASSDNMAIGCHAAIAETGLILPLSFFLT